MASIAEQQRAAGREAVVRLATHRITTSTARAKEARGHSARAMRTGNLPGSDALAAMADAFEAEVVIWTRLRDEWTAEQPNARGESDAG
jgi:hypothetical protein